MKKLAVVVAIGGLLLGTACDPGKAEKAGHSKDSSRPNPKITIVTTSKSPAGKPCSLQAAKKKQTKKYKGHIYTCKLNGKTHLYIWVG